ncbi:VOC family protein [Hyphobacterium sp.]|uniref:VOC family protein n=1 Tax=Hyphobacterium sp. TaxID=2004662 RepID=UPI003B52553D
MAKITGLGGIFHVVKDPAATRAWYQEYLGIGGEYGPILKWSEEAGEDPYSLVGPFTSNEYFQPSSKEFMINLRVDDIDGMVAQLRDKGIEILGEVDEGYGKFAWFLDCDGVKIELWQQIEGPDAANSD